MTIPLPLARGDQHDGRALGFGAAGATAAMHVRVRGHGHLIVHDEIDALDVDAARGDVGGDENRGSSRARAARARTRRGAGNDQVLETRALLHVPVETLHGEAKNLQDGEQSTKRGDGVHEHDDQTRLLRENVVQQRVALILSEKKRGTGRRDTLVSPRSSVPETRRVRNESHRIRGDVSFSLSAALRMTRDETTHTRLVAFEYGRYPHDSLRRKRGIITVVSSSERPGARERASDE